MITLGSLFPAGLFDPHGNVAAQNAARALQILERLIHEGSSATARLTQHALFQALSDPVQGPAAAGGGSTERPGEWREFLRLSARALMPPWQEGLLKGLNDQEAETLLKLFLVAHEQWGTAQGISTVVGAMLEQAVHAPIAVRPAPLDGEMREIPGELCSRLGTRLAGLGSELVLGDRLRCRPRQLTILVGPLASATLGRFEKAGWAEGTHAGKKLRMVLALAEPFYMRTEVIFLLRRTGFILGKALLAEDRVGEVEGGGDEGQEVMGVVHG